jgi:YD repeat-containing protein
MTNLIWRALQGSSRAAYSSWRYPILTMVATIGRHHRTGWLNFVMAVSALSPINTAMAGLGAENATDLGTVNVQGYRLDAFGVNYLVNRFSTLDAPLYGTGYVFVPASSVPLELKTPEVPEEDPCDKKGPATAGNPVVLVNGNKIEREMDFVSQGEAPLHLQRAYSHYWVGVGIFGKHWLSNFDFKLTFGGTSVNSCYPRPGGGSCSIGANTYIYAWRPDGRVHSYKLNPVDGVFYGVKANSVSKIIKQANGDFVLHGEGDQVETYSSAGYISSVKNAQGIGWTFTYTNTTYPYRVTHTSGRYVEFNWTGNQLTAVRDPGGNYYGFTYAANQFGTGLHRLASASAPGNPATTITYHYEHPSDASALTGKSFNGVRYSTFSYSATGTYPSVSETTHGGIDTWKFTYEDFTAQPGGITITTSVNPLGRSAKSVYAYGKLWKTWGLSSPSCPGTVVETTYNTTTGYPERVLDAKGFSTTFTYNDKGQLLTQTEAEGTPFARITRNAWDTTHNRMLSQAVDGVGKTSYTYTADNRIASVSYTNLLSPSPANNLNQTRTTLYSYTKHPNGMLATETVDGPLPGSGDAVVTTYDSLGNLLTISNSLNHTTTYNLHNSLGQPGRFISPNGDRTDFVYDERGRVTEVKKYINGITSQVTYRYGASGLLDAVVNAVGTETHYVYDAARRLIEEYQQESDGMYARRLYTYNAMSLPTSIDVVRADFPPGTRVIGHIDGTTVSSSGDYTLGGWACATGVKGSITVHVYLGGAAGTGQLLGGYAANQTSESSVAASCQAAGTAYRFAVALPVSVRQAHQGKSIYVHGIAPSGSGASNALISASGTFIVPAPPSAPALSVPTSSSGSYTVSWSAVSPSVAKYQLQERVNAGSWATIQDSAGTNQAMSGKPAGTYEYQVRACTDTGCGVFSAIKSTTVLLPPSSAPVVTTPASNATGSYSVSWTTVSGAESYELQEQLNGGVWATIANAAATSKSITGKSNATYGYHVRACNSSGCGPYSQAVNTVVTLSPVPATPSMTSPPFYSTTGSYTAAWGGVSGATSYRLEESRDYGAWTEIYNGPGTGVSLSKGTEISKDFSYRVRACNASGCSAYSATRTVTIEGQSCPTCQIESQPLDTQSTVTQDGGEGA